MYYHEMFSKLIVKTFIKFVIQLNNGSIEGAAVSPNAIVFCISNYVIYPLASDINPLIC